MKKFVTIFAAILIVLASAHAYSQVNTWDGSTSTAWMVPANWSLGHVPTSAEDVVIPSAPVNQPLVSGVAGVCQNLTVNSGATLTIGATTTTNGSLTLSGSAIMNGALSIGGSISKTGKLIAVNITWASTATLSGYYNGGIELSGNWEFSTGSAISMGYCGVTFTGATSASIISKSSSSSFSSVTISKTGGSTLTISNTSTANLEFNGSVTIATGSYLIGSANITTIFKSSLYNAGHFSFNTGTVSMEQSSGTQSIQVNSGDAFYNLTINGGATVTVNNYTQIQHNVTIQSGIFDPLGNVVVLFGDWSNTVGSAGFTEGTSRVVFSGGNYHQYSSNETFNILEVHKAIGGAFRVNGTTVTCTQYDWTAGSVDVLSNGTFTANDLADDGLFGGYYVNPGSTINLYQDGSQFIDLNGDLVFTGGGTINVSGGSSASVWAYADDASITMNGGLLDFKTQGFTLLSAAAYTFTGNITGGTIRTTGSVLTNSAAFDPTGGTLEMYGSGNRSLQVTGGWLHHLTINKTTGYTVTLNSSGTINGNFTVDNGTFTADNKVITLGGNLNLNDYGIFHIGPASQLKMAGGMSIIVGNGGLFETFGTGADNAVVTHSAGYYYLDVQAGGTISSRHTTFLYSYRLMIGMDGIIDPANAFYSCTFTNFSTSSFLSVHNNQTLSLHNVNFPSLPPVNNVSKGTIGGRLVFKDATGAFAGSAFEYDPYNRIDWVSSTPGLWTGEISSDWYAEQNWDDYNVPTGPQNVTIPAGTPFSPLVSTGDAYCAGLTIQAGATLTVGDGDLTVLDDLTIFGQVAETHSGADIVVQGSVFWEAGSTADISASGRFQVYRDWEFRNGTEARLANGLVYFTGSVISYIRCHEANAAFFNLANIKTAGSVYFSTTSTDTLKVNGSIINEDATSVFYANSALPLVLKESLVNAGHFYCPQGTVILNGITGYLNLNTGDYFNNIVFNSSGDVLLIDSLRVHGNLAIQSGRLVTQNYPVLIQGNWTNNVGSAGFSEGTGKVVFEGAGTSDILTDETFYNLSIDKTYAGFDGVEINDSVTVIYNLAIDDGTMEMNPGSRVHVGNQLTINAGAGLNADDTDVAVYSAEDWFDSNLAASATEGFKAGSYSVVHFRGKASNIQTIQENCPFNDIRIEGVGLYAMPSLYDVTCKNLEIKSGAFRLAGRQVSASGNVTVGSGALRMDNAADVLSVDGDVLWQPGSSETITAGTINAGRDWTFQNGTTAVLGTGNTVIFNQAGGSVIRCDDTDAAFGNLVIGKPAGVSADTYIHGSSADTVRVAGTMTVNSGNQFHVQSRRLSVIGALDVQNTAEMDMTSGGYLVNKAASFVLNGKLNVNAGTALIHGTFEEAVTGELDIAGGSFTSDAPSPGGYTWQYLRGNLTMSGGRFEITNNSISIAATATTAVSGGEIVAGFAFHAQSAGTFQPTGGKLKSIYSGAGTAYIYCSAGNYLYDLEIAGQAGIQTDVTVKNDVIINSGYLSSETYDLYVEGDWANYVGANGFYEYSNTVSFTGSTDSHILTDEVFYDLVEAKTHTNYTALDLMEGSTLLVLHDLLINDGSLEMEQSSTLSIANDLAIALNAGLNANDYMNVINIGGDWTNFNTTYSDNYGFNPGSNIVVTFLGTTDQYLSTAATMEDFGTLRISKGLGSFRSNDNIRCLGNLEVVNGTWEDNVAGLTHTVNRNLTVSSTGAIMNAFAQNTFEFKGYDISVVSYGNTTGCFHDLVFNKSTGGSVSFATNVNCLIGGSFTVENGPVNVNGYRVWVEGDAAVNSESVLTMPASSSMVLTNGKTLAVNSGGRFEIAGTSVNPVTLRADISTARFAFSINSGGTLSAEYGVFKNMSMNGLNLAAGSSLDPAHTLRGCTFQDGAAGGSLLTINNDQVITVRNAIFPVNSWGGTSNVAKTVGTGHVYFVDFSGGFSGESFDADPLNLIDWVPALVAPASATPASICAGSSSQLNVIPVGGLAPFTYIWSPVNGLNNPFTNDPLATPAATTIYSVTVTDYLGSTATGSVPVTVNPVLPVSITITASANPSPPGYYVNFTATPVNGGTSPVYQWIVNGLNVGSGLPSYSYVPSYGDDVQCVLYSNYACPSGNPASSNTIVMAVVPVNTAASGVVPAPLNLCFNASNTVTVAGGGDSLVVSPGARATMIAGVRILYRYGTKVRPGGYMHGYITTTNSYCGSLPPAMVAVNAGSETLSNTEEETSPVTSEPIRRFSVYPNPTNGPITLKCLGSDDPGKIIAEVLNMRGEKVLTATYSDGSSHQMRLDGLPSGLYFVRIRTSGNTETIKLILTP